MSVSTFVYGAGQITWRNNVEAPDPAAAMAAACEIALQDAGLDHGVVDALGCVEPLAWNYQDLGATVAGHLGLKNNVEHLWLPAGGTSPQDLLHQFSLKMESGELDVALICGAETMRTRRRHVRNGSKPDWPPRADGVNPMRGQKAFSSDLEQQHGLRAPIQVFPLFENAIRAANNRSAQQQTDIAAGILAKNAKVAQANPYAWFQTAPSQDEIATITPDNRLIAYPYTKRMNAIMDVDQCAAILMVSSRFLEQRTDAHRAAAVLGGTAVEEIWNPIERTSFAECLAMNHAIDITLKRSGLTAEELDGMDLYSCFPSAIEFGLNALGTDEEDPRPFSLTGGLAFAGGPGNAYVLHSLATALERIREVPASRLLVTGIGMANTKHAATVLTGAEHVPAAATGQASYREALDETPRIVAPNANGSASVCSYTVEYDRAGEASNIIWLLDLEDGRRTIANSTQPGDVAAQISSIEPIGCAGTVEHDACTGRNLFDLRV